MKQIYIMYYLNDFVQDFTAAYYGCDIFYSIDTMKRNSHTKLKFMNQKYNEMLIAGNVYTLN